MTKQLGELLAAEIEFREELDADGKSTGKRRLAAKGKKAERLIDLVAEKVLEKCLRGDGRLIVELWQRLDGKVPDKVITREPDAIRRIRVPRPEEDQGRLTPTSGD